MLPKHPDQMTDSDLQAWVQSLVDSREPENSRLDYKAELHFTTRRERIELARDISSFANERGGTIIYGIPEDPVQEGIPNQSYGIDPIPGVEEVVRRIWDAVIVPRLPGPPFLRKVELAKPSGKVVYIAWTPESWFSPHMVQEYGQGRYFLRRESQTVLMSERDVEEAYRRRILMGGAVEDFLSSPGVRNLEKLVERWLAPDVRFVTTMVVVPRLLVSNRIDFSEADVRSWLGTNTLAGAWKPSMVGVRVVFSAGDPEDRMAAEMHRNSALVMCRPTMLASKSPQPTIASIAEIGELQYAFKVAGALHSFLGYSGPLLISLRISCLPNSILGLTVGRQARREELLPRGTPLSVRLEPSAADLSADWQSVLKDLSGQVGWAFGQWRHD